MDGFSDAELQRLVNDPRFGPDDVRLLSADEQGRLARLKSGQGTASEGGSLIGRTASTAGDVSVGAAKGAGDTSFSLGKAVHSIPGIGSITDALGDILGEGVAHIPGVNTAATSAANALFPNGGNPNDPFATRPKGLEATNTAQSIGKGAEQIGEFFIPAGVARKAAVEGLVRLIPDAASPGAMKVLNKMGAVIGHTVGEAASAGAVADVHGDPHAGREAMIAGAAPMLASGGGALAKAILPIARDTTVSRMLSAMLAAPISKVADLGGGAGASFGVFGATRAAIQKALANPDTPQVIKRVLYQWAPRAGRATAGAMSNAETQK